MSIVNQDITYPTTYTTSAIIKQLIKQMCGIVEYQEYLQ